jgi:hypothetical protein
VADTDKTNRVDLKPWQFKPGRSGNPGGRVKGIERVLREQLKGDLPKIAEAMRDIVFDLKAKDSDRIKAAEWIYDRCFGKPKQSIDLSGDAGVAPFDYSALSDAQLDALAALKTVNRPSESPDDGSDTDPVH